MSISFSSRYRFDICFNERQIRSVSFIFPGNIIITEPMASFSQITRSINVIDIQNLVRYKVICNVVSHCMVVKIMRCH